MKQQIVLSGLGGQGILFITRVLAEAAVLRGLEVLTSETHGMAMRGGTVISHVKVGSFSSPLISSGKADIGIFLHLRGLEAHRAYVAGREGIYVNTDIPGDYHGFDATSLAARLGAAVIANLVFLGHVARHAPLFCDERAVRQAIEKISPRRQLELNVKGLEAGLGGQL
ncbi:MAG TPA: 2-oxoacid:acceptor oxidoreductase family protein [Syntrophales bacterium]|nr:2-oxoacid:acceptor oxidoreductase family protein [Syntrophales bacterium]HPI56917.1 2-oxoacid:acceptor oxidoreductase family protein [Syntrophales bacterium]HPN23503.1 2-oxoacid:acceptor oxidoreductase family protein [Syntrophales bacterium]HQM27972.1 2-oxoacid:acceptor oxidoreductase family protein [Syntrophales bacterium]